MFGLKACAITAGSSLFTTSTDLLVVDAELWVAHFGNATQQRHTDGSDIYVVALTQMALCGDNDKPYANILFSQISSVYLINHLHM